MALRYKYKPQRGMRREPGAAAKVVEWARALVGEDENTGVGLGVNACGHAACRGEETVILLMRRNEPTVGIKISKSVEAVTEADVAEALQPFLSPVRVISVR